MVYSLFVSNTAEKISATVTEQATAEQIVQQVVDEVIVAVENGFGSSRLKATYLPDQVVKNIRNLLL